MLQYNPEDAVTVWPKGDYEAVLKKVETKTSKVKEDGTGGNPMEAWTFEVYNEQRQQLITDYVVIPACTFKIKQLAIALGRQDEFKTGQFQASDHLNANVMVELVIEEGQGFDDKNKISRVKAAVGTPAPQRPAQLPIEQPASPNRLGPIELAKRAAWDQFKLSWDVYVARNPSTGEERGERFKEYVAEATNQTDSSRLLATDWRGVSTRLRRAGIQPPTPVSDSPEFADDDIPF